MTKQIPAGIIVLLMTAYTACAQAWPQTQGVCYTKLSYGASTAALQYAFDGAEKNYADNVTENAFFDRSIYWYAECGITDNLTVMAALPYKRLIVRDAAFRYRTYAFGSAQAGVRHTLKPYLTNLLGDADALSANFLLTVPTGFTRNYTPSAGSGQVDAELSLNYGRSLYPLPMYAQAGLGYRYRAAIYAFSKAVPCQEGSDKNCFADKKPDFGNEFTFDLNGGWFPVPWALVNLALRGSFSVTAPTEGFSVANPIPTRQRFIKAGAGLALSPLDGLSVNGMISFTPYGRNTIKSVDVILGVDYKFQLWTKKSETPSKAEEPKPETQPDTEQPKQPEPTTPNPGAGGDGK